MTLRLRRGGTTTGAPPGAPEFGPTISPDWVRNNAVPRPITVPDNAVEFISEADLINKIASNPSNTNFKSLPAATYAWTTPFQEAVKHPNIYFLPGAIIDGQNNSSSGITGFSSEPESTSVGMAIRGGEFKNFWRAFSMAGGSVFEDALIHDCFEKGFNWGGSNNLMSHLTIHTTGKYGFNGNTVSGFGTGNLIEHCQVYNANTIRYDPANDAGGSKMLRQDGLICRYNWGHDNYGTALWWDITNINCQIYENVVETNRNCGIFYEISGGGTSIYRNYALNNTNGLSDFGTGQILVSGCDATSGGSFPSIEVYRNWIDGPGTQVQMGIVNHLGHGLSKGTHFHDNDVWDRGTTLGRMTGLASPNGTVPLTDDNTWENNHYHVLTSQVGAKKFMFGTTQTDSTQWQTFTQWQAAGRDDTGTLVSI